MTDFFDWTRRGFLKTGAVAFAGAGLTLQHGVDAGVDALDPTTLTPFVDALPVPRMMKPRGMRAHPEQAGQQIPLPEHRLPQRNPPQPP